MSDKTEYLKSIAENDFQRFIVDHLDEDPEVFLEKCIEYLKGESGNA